MPTISRAGQRVVYDDLGDGPRAVLLAHNLFSSRASFREVAARLSRDVRVLNVDLRGHGDSRGAAPFTVDDLAGDLAAVLEAADVASAVLVGTSLGAAAAVQLARVRPAQVRGLVLMAANPFASGAGDRLSLGAASVIVRALGPAPLLSTFVAALHAESAPAATRAASAAQIRAMDRADLGHAVRAWLGRPALVGRLGRLPMPVRVVAGAADTSCPWPASAALAAELGAPLRIIAGAGHTLQADRPDAVAALAAELLA